MRSQALRSAPGAQQAKAVGARRAAKQVRERTEADERHRERGTRATIASEWRKGKNQKPKRKKRWLFFSSRSQRDSLAATVCVVFALSLCSDCSKTSKRVLIKVSRRAWNRGENTRESVRIRRRRRLEAPKKETTAAPFNLDHEKNEKSLTPFFFLLSLSLSLSRPRFPFQLFPALGIPPPRRVHQRRRCCSRSRGCQGRRSLRCRGLLLLGRSPPRRPPRRRGRRRNPSLDFAQEVESAHGESQR